MSPSINNFLFGDSFAVSFARMAAHYLLVQVKKGYFLGYLLGTTVVPLWYHWVPALVGDSNSNDPKTRLKTNKEYCFFISMWHHSMACLSWLICHQELRGTLWGWVCERPGDHCHLQVMTFQ